MATENNTNTTYEVSPEAEYNFYLIEAPIADFAEFAGIELDEAVNRRIEAARQTVNLSQVNVDVRLLNQPQGKMIGLATVEYHGFRMDGFKVFNGEKGLFLGEPTTRDGRTNNFVKTIRVAGDELRDTLNKKAYEGYTVAVEKLYARVTQAHGMEVKPRIKDALAEGQRQAAAHNAQNPPQQGQPVVSGERG